MSADHYVVIVNKGTHKPETVMGPMSLNRAERVYRGACININEEDFAADIVEEADMPEHWKELAK